MYMESMVVSIKQAHDKNVEGSKFKFENAYRKSGVANHPTSDGPAVAWQSRT